MILEYKNNEGYIYAYIVWSTMDQDNRVQENGEVLSIGGTWIHPDFRYLGILKNMINDLFVHKANQNVLYVLHGRSKYRERPNKLIPASRYLKYIKGEKYATR